jgi:hypothetical protein
MDKSTLFVVGRITRGEKRIVFVNEPPPPPPFPGPWDLQAVITI